MHYRACMLYELIFNLISRREHVECVNEPKKINIARCKAGTNINGINNNFERHTKVFIKNPSVPESPLNKH